MIYYNRGSVTEYEPMPETLEFDETVIYQYDGIIETKMVTSTEDDLHPAYQIKFYHNGMELEGILPAPIRQPIDAVMYGTIYFKNMKFFPIAKASIEIISAELRYNYEGKLPDDVKRRTRNMYEYNMENVKEFKAMPDDFDFEDDVVYQFKGTFEVKPHEIYHHNAPAPFRYEHDGNYIISFCHNGTILGGVVPPTDDQFISQYMNGEVYFKNPKFYPVADIEVEIVAAFLQ